MKREHTAGKMKQNIYKNPIMKQMPGKTLFTIFLLLTFLLSQVSLFGFGVNAQDLSGVYNFITGVSLTDADGNPLGQNIAKDSLCRLTYAFAIPNQGDVMAGDTLVLQVPEQLLISDPFDFTVSDDSGTLIADGTVTTNGAIAITFTNYAETHSNVRGSFWFEFQFNKDKIGLEDPAAIVFQVGGTSDPVSIIIDFDQPAPLPTSVVKTGAYDWLTNTITWTATVNPENVVVRNGQLADTLAADLDFVPGSVKINGLDAALSDYTFSSGVLTYQFPAVIQTQQVVTFKTTIKDAAFAGSHNGATLTEKNTATLNHDGTFTVSNEAQVPVPVSFISKAGTYSSARKQIDWTITVNESGLTIPDAVVTDTLPANLTLAAGSVKIDGQLSDRYDNNNSTITFNLGSISEKHVITFSTDVNPALYLTQTNNLTFNNTGVLSGGNVPAGTSAGTGVGVSFTRISKSGTGYNASTHEISWSITVNNNSVPIDNPVITDVIRIGQEYVEGSAVISPADSTGGSFTYIPATAGDAAKTGTLIYTFGSGSTISRPYTVSFKTRVTIDADYSGNGTKAYNNTAIFSGTNITSTTATGSRNVVSEVVKKTGTGYDYQTRELTWKVVVNKNAMPLHDVVFSDFIPTGTEYVDGSASIDNGASASGFVYTAAEGSDSSKTGTLTYTFPASINQTYTITFKTRVTDLSIFQTNGIKIFSNTSMITHSLLPGGVTSTGTQTVNNTVVSKNAAYTAGKKYIDWSVIINQNDIPLNSAILTDTLQDGLALDTTSVRLFRQSLNADGSLTKGSEITLSAANIQYNLNTRLFTFTFPSPASGPYLLTFRTDVTDKTKSPFINSCIFNGTGTLQPTSSGSIPVSWAGSGAGGSGEVGSITIHKVDSKNADKVLSGAVFNLIDKYGNTIQQGTTDATGTLVFERIRFDVTYVIRETVAPTGYLTAEDYLFSIGSTDPVKDIDVTCQDDVITGCIELQKNDDSGNALGGAEFTLYDHDNAAVASAVSDDAGIVSFSSVPYGEYTIRETKAPDGYIVDDTIYDASVTTQGTIYDAGTAVNTLIRGSIILQKNDEAGNVLAGAVFTLYNAGGTSIASSASDGNGEVVFTNIPYGTYSIKETKAPTGRVTDIKTFEASVTENGVTVNAGISVNTLIHGNILLQKNDDSGKALAGAEFTIYNSDGQTVGISTSDSAGKVLFTGLPYGDYQIQETKVPTGYMIDAAVYKASVTENGVTVNAGTSVNTLIEKDISGSTRDVNKKTIVKTGETDTVFTQVSLFLLTGAVLLYITYKIKFNVMRK